MKPEPNGHLAAYRHAFGPDPSVAPGAIDARLVAVVFTNRCGSMLLTEMIGSSPDILTRYEVFNGEVVARKAVEHGFATLGEYLGFLFPRAGATCTAKIHVRQLGFLAAMGVLDAFAGGVEILRVRRRDRVAQAVSHSIARQTGRWTSFAAAGDTDRDGEPEYDFHEIRDVIRGIEADDRHFDALAERLGLRFTELVFEDFLRDPAAVLVPLWQRLGVRPGTPDAGGTRHRRQATGLNAEFARRFLAEARAGAC